MHAEPVYNFDPVNEPYNIHVDVLEPGLADPIDWTPSGAIDPGGMSPPPQNWDWLFWLGLAGLLFWSMKDKKGGLLS